MDNALKKQLVKNAKKLRTKAEAEIQAANAKIDLVNGSYAQQTSTHRRMAMQASSIHAQEDRLRIAQQMISIAAAMERDKIVFLAKVATKADVDTIQGLVRTAHTKYAQAMSPSRWYDFFERTPISPKTAEYAEVDKLFIWRDVENLINLMVKFEIKVEQPLQAIHDWFATDTQHNGYRPNQDEIVAIKTTLKEIQRCKKELLGTFKSWNAPSIHLPDHMIDSIKRWDRLDRLGFDSNEAIQNGLCEFLSLKVEEVAPVQDPVELKLKQIAMMKINGYFPTPKPVVDQLLEFVQDRFPTLEGLRALEPSAGGGHIADALKEAGLQVDVVEFSCTLAEVLTEKGYHLVATDTFEHTGDYDVVVMNPPFEKSADIDHVRHAFDNQLRAGGRLVSVMSTGPFYRSDKKAENWREWFEEHGGIQQPLPEGSFKMSDRSTGTNTVIVVLDKD